MRKHVVTILLLCLAAMPLAAQQWTSEQLARANTARNASYLSEQEKQVIFLCNLARMDGALFAATYLAQHTPNDPSNWYIASLYRDLQSVNGLPPLFPYDRFYATSAYHAADMGRSGRTGHTSSDGTDFADRVYGGLGEKTYIAENCSYGYNNDQAINIVVQLLVDANVPSLGHRKNILNPDLSAIGVAIAPHAIYEYMCVMDFAKLANIRQ